MVRLPAMERKDAACKRSAIAELRSGGEYLLHSAKMVGDEEDYFIWRSSCRAWIDSGSPKIAATFGEDAGAEFDRSCRARVQKADWKRQYEFELRTINAALGVLVRLEDELDPSGSSLEFA